ncbi:MAG: hypothetical protein D3914_01805 [Candidatus Electrothrix sp. LOE2]|nr:hypothetical protein [Candidatus Electrothrix sp. LOE2]
MNSNNIKVIIDNKPYPLPIEMRPVWRMCLIVIAIAEISGKKKNLELNKVNILVWMLIRKNKWEEYLHFLDVKGYVKNVPLVSVDSSTYKAIEYSISKKIVALRHGRLHLTNLGDDTFSLLVANEIMNDERLFLQDAGMKLTVQKIKELTGGSF